MLDVEHCPSALKPLQAVADVVTVPPSRRELAKLIPDFDAYLASLHIRIDWEIIDLAGRLKIIATASTGTDHIDMDSVVRRDIAVLSLRNETSFLSGITSTAEMAWALLLAVVRKLPWSFEAAKHGEWARDRFRGRQLSGKTLGILGYGRLGRIIAEYGRAFRMRVLAHDILDVLPAEGIELVDFETLLSESDALSIHIHLTEENRGLFTDDVFNRMKPGVVLINTSRGAIIDEAALIRALESGRLLGAGVDVIHGEWNENLAAHPLIRYAATHDNLVISPHTGGVTVEAQSMAIEFIARKLAGYLRSLEKPEG